MKFWAFFIQSIKPIYANYNKTISFLADFCVYLKKKALLCIIIANFSDYLDLILSMRTKFI